MTGKPSAFKQRFADGSAAIGAAVAGIGVYGVLLYDVNWLWAAVAICGGLAALFLALLAGGRLDNEPNNSSQRESD